MNAETIIARSKSMPSNLDTDPTPAPAMTVEQATLLLQQEAMSTRDVAAACQRARAFPESRCALIRADQWQAVADIMTQLAERIAELETEREETLQLAEHPDVSSLKDLARELVYRAQRIAALEAQLTERPIPTVQEQTCQCGHPADDHVGVRCLAQGGDGMPICDCDGFKPAVEEPQ